MRKILFPGTFDPPSLGHLDIIKKASKIADRLLVAVGINLAKKNPLFPIKKRLELLQEMAEEFSNVEITSFEGPVADFAKEKDVNFIVRGLRPFSDMAHEIQMAIMNRKMTGIETLFLVPDEKYSYISSSLVRELAFYHANLGEFVSKKVEKAIYQQAKASEGK